jgi:signal transduction histidine kinase
MDQASGVINKLSSLRDTVSAECSWGRLVSQVWSERWIYLLFKLALTALVALLIYFLLSLFFVQSNYYELISAVGALLIFVSLYPWLELSLERRLRPDRFIYRQLIEEYGHVVRETSDLNLLLQYVSQTLLETLRPRSVSAWLYQVEDNLLVLACAGGSLAADLLELPVDISPDQLSGTQYTGQLPESALRQGLINLGIETATSLSLRDELVGIIGMGRYDRQHRPETLRVLDLMAGQLALAVKNARLIADLEETLNKLQLAYRRTIDAQEEERRSLAVELHDDILSRLTTMGMTLSHSQRQLPDDTSKIQASLEMLGQETHYLNCRLREITQGLYPAILADLGLIAALQAYMDSLTKHAFVASVPRTIDLTAQGFNGARINDSKLERDLYYITRQAVDNALRHSQAEQIFIHLRWRDNAVTVTVHDTGIGLRVAPKLLMGQHGHLGLLSLQERVLAWRGRLSFQTGPGQGTTVYARLPIDQPSPNPNHLQAFTHYLRGVSSKE